MTGVSIELTAAIPLINGRWKGALWWKGSNPLLPKNYGMAANHINRIFVEITNMMTMNELIKLEPYQSCYEQGLFDAFKDCILDDGEYCWQSCVCVEHCGECSLLNNGQLNYYETIK